MPKALRRAAFYAGVTGIIIVPIVGCALSTQLSAAECIVVPQNTRVSISGVVRFTDYSTAFAACGAVAILLLADAIFEYDSSVTGRVITSLAALPFSAPFIVPISSAQSYTSGAYSTPTDWVHTVGAATGVFFLWVYMFYLMEREANIAVTTLFSCMSASIGVGVASLAMDALGAEALARQLVIYGVFWSEFGIAGTLLGLFNYVTRDKTRPRFKLFNLGT
jgi:hypothetical protein